MMVTLVGEIRALVGRHWREVTRGAMVIVRGDNGARWQRWRSANPQAKDRLFSTHHVLAHLGRGQYEIRCSVDGAQAFLLVGCTKDNDTFFLFEATSGSNPTPRQALAHLKSAVVHLVTDVQHGPHGTSRHGDQHPLIVPAR